MKRLICILALVFVLTTVLSRAQTPAYVPARPSITNLVCEGDSITAGVNTSGNSKRYCDVSLTLPALAGRTIGYHNFAVSGNQIADLVSRYVASVKPYCQARNALLSVMIGTNNLGTGGMTAAATFSALASYWSTAKADGCKVGAWTVLPRSDSSWTSAQEAYRQQLNASIRSSTIPDYIFDGEFAAPANGDVAIYPDHLHPNDTGHAALANQMNAVLQGTKIFAPLNGAAAAYAPNFAQVVHLASGTDVNTINVGGAYDINGITNGPPGSSAVANTGNAWWYLQVTPSSVGTGYVMQIATTLLATTYPLQRWQRVDQGGTWGAWVPIYGSGFVSSTDLNSLTSCGMYAGQNLTNGPFGTAWTHVLVLCGDPATGTGYTAQIATPLLTTTSQMMMRVENGGTWGSWAAVLGTSLLAASTDLNTITAPGSYDGVNLVNSPLGSAWTHLIVFGSDLTTGTNWPVQFATNFLGGTTVLYERVDNNGTWSSWSQAALFDSSGNLAIGTGTNVVYRCATAGATLPIGSLTINSAACGTTTDTGLRVK